MSEIDPSLFPFPALPEGEKSREDAKPPLHALSGMIDSVLRALPQGTGTDDLLLIVLLVILLNNDREDRFGLIVAIGYLLLFGHDGSTA